MPRYVGIDPSTKTGFVALDEAGNVDEKFEIEHKGNGPAPMIAMIDGVSSLLKPGDFIAIEGFGFSSMQGIQLGGIGWGIRMDLHRKGITYIEATPTQVKKFATGSGTADKSAVAVGVFKHFGFEDKSDNVRDAYVLAQIARAYYTDCKVLKYQGDVITAMKNPTTTKKGKGKGKKGNETSKG